MINAAATQRRYGSYPLQFSIIDGSATGGRQGNAETITITGPKVGRFVDATLWGAKRLRDYAQYDHFLITKILTGCQERGRERDSVYYSYIIV